MERWLKNRWARVFLPILGAASFLWVLIRVGPKPSRAAYPCQKVAAPLAGTFIVWVTSIAVWVLGRRKAFELLRRSRLALGMTCLIVAIGSLAMAVSLFPQRAVVASPVPAHEPLGEGVGLYPGRVVWVHAPEATDWAGPGSGEHWFDPACTDQAVVDLMMSQAIRGVGGGSTDEEAWERIFRHFNLERDRGDHGYTPGEKIAIKPNLVTCWAGSGSASTLPGVDPETYDKTRWVDYVDVSPQMIRALLQQLVDVVGIPPEDITVGDPTTLFPNDYLDLLLPEFARVNFLDNLGGAGRVRAEFSDTPLFWSTPYADGTLQDRLPNAFAEATYVINFAVLKSHSSGVTLCGKNHYGSLIRLPNGYLRDAGYPGYYNMHDSLPNEIYDPGLSKYRAIVDLMAHEELGGKTLLYLLDGLYSGYYAITYPYPWRSAPFGDGVGGDWPSSLFASMDPVAIDSVGHDFLLEEWPEVVLGGTVGGNSLQGGAEDYLHEAALAHAPPSGTFYDPEGDGAAAFSLGAHEHWNNPIEKLYSRDLGFDAGIELIRLTANKPATVIRECYGVSDHRSAGVLTTALPLIEPRIDGVQSLVLQFDPPAVEAVNHPGVVGVHGSRSGDLSHLVESVVWHGLDAVTVNLGSPLPDSELYTFVLNRDLFLVGDRVIEFAVLQGDITGDGRVNNSDLIRVRRDRGKPVTEATCLCDVNRDGRISNSDLIAVRRMRGNSL